MYRAFIDQARSQPDSIAVSCLGVDYSYGELLERIQHRQFDLRSRVPGDSVIGVFADNSIEFLEVLLAVPGMGRTLAIINSRADLTAATAVVNRVQPGLLLIDSPRKQRFGEQLATSTLVIDIDAPAMDRGLDDRTGERSPLFEPPAGVPTPDAPAWLIHTSGTTADSKGVLLPNRSIDASAQNFVERLELHAQSRLLMPFSLSHVTAHAIPAALAVGARIYLQDRFNALDYLETIESERITLAPVAPAMLHMLLEEPTVESIDFSSLTHLFYGSASISEQLLRRALQTFHNAGFVQAYGLTETCGAALWLTAEDHRAGLTGDSKLLRAAGKPSPGVEAKVADSNGESLPTGTAGELLLRGPQLMLGYFEDPEATAAAFVDGWFRTGDVAVQDHDEYFYIVDRIKDMVVSGGENVSSQEVERVMLGHEAVADAAVIGLPHEKWGEIVVAVVVLTPDSAAEVTPDMLIAHARDSLAGYKVPQQVHIVSQLPRNHMGKVLKRELKEHLAPQAAGAR